MSRSVSTVELRCDLLGEVGGGSMSGIGKWNLGIGVGLLVLAVLCSVLKLIPVAVITGVLGLIGVGVAGYDVLYNWLDRAAVRRRAALVDRNREPHEGR
jgi:uncharacterized membrane protein